MNDSKQSNDYFNLVFSGLSAIAGILAALSPLLGNNPISQLFIDKNLIFFASVISVIIVILLVWFSYSIGAFVIFGRTIDNMEKFRLTSLIYFGISSLFFYSLYVASINNYINQSLGSVLQLTCYLASFYFISLSIGLTLQATVTAKAHHDVQDNIVNSIINMLVKTNILPIKVRILSISQHAQAAYPNDINLQWSYDVIFEIEDSQTKVDKKYHAIFHGSMKRIVRFEEITEVPANIQQTPGSTTDSPT